MEPSDALDLLRFRLVSCLQSDDDIKGQIISSFTSEPPLRIVCATLAFGSGLDCTDVCQVIHVGTPDDDIQETGRGDRDGNLSLATLLVVHRNNKKMSVIIKRMILITRHDLLLQNMDNYKHVEASVCAVIFA